MKKLLSLFLLVVLLIPPLAAKAGSFPDINVNSKYFAALEYLKEKGVISGYPDGKFQPDKIINRAEALKIVLRAIEALAKMSTAESGGAVKPDSTTEGASLTQTGVVEGQTSATSSPTDAAAENAASPSQKATGTVAGSAQVFPDVKADDWFYSYVNQGYQMKVVEGYPDGTFQPQNNINVAESMKVIFRAFKVSLHPLPLAENPFVDALKDEWYAVYALYGKEKQLILAQGDGKLHAERDITRADFADIVYRLMYVEEAQLDKFPLSKDWPTFVHPTDHYSVKYSFDWQKIEAGKQTVFWKQDVENGQVSFARVFPNSGTVVMAVDKNTEGLSLDQYLANIQYDSSTNIQKLSLNDYPFASITIPETGLRDFYFELPNKSILLIYSQIGGGSLKSQLQEEVRYLVGSIRFTEQGGVDLKEDFLSAVRKNLLIKEKGQTTIDSLTDASVIETDTIGIGTGPIDYYYSALYDITLKYERNSDTLLAMKSGKTSAF